MKKTILKKRKIMETIKKLPESSFTILDFTETFKKLFPKREDSLGVLG
ncbi:MAG: hypothetical protein AB1393_10350 [Candidatus Edwardsbacteria bacterium]